MADPYQILVRALGLIRQGWTQGAEARDEQGRPVPPTDPLATQWSVLGALNRAEFTLRRPNAHPSYWELLAAHELLYFKNSLSTSLKAWNDDAPTTQAEVIRALERAFRPQLLPIL